MEATLKDIAKATGFSVNTVSRALRDDRAISQKTKDIIKSKANELNYIPNALASSMRSMRSGLIGVISADSTNPFFGEVIKGIEERATNFGYQLMLGCTEESIEKEEKLIKMFLSRRLDGLIIMPVFDNSDEHIEIFKRLSRSVPFVFAGRYLEGLREHSILHQEFTGQRYVFDYLFSKGHKNILYIAGPENVSNSGERIKGMLASYEKNNVQFLPEYMKVSTGRIEDGYRIVNQALNRGLEFTAVACFNDMIAMGAMKSLAENDLKVPEDVEVFGYDNLFLSQFFQPSLSTVDVPRFKLGQRSMEVLDLMIKKKDVSKMCETELPIRLVFRGSTR